MLILWKTKDQMLLGSSFHCVMCVYVWSVLSQTSKVQVDISSLLPFFCHHSSLSICKDVRQVCHVWGHFLTSPRKAKLFHKGGQPQRHWIAPSVLWKTAKPGVGCTREKKEAWMINWGEKKNHMINITKATGAGKRCLQAWLLHRKTNFFLIYRYNSCHLCLSKSLLMISPVISHMIRETLLPPFQQR